MKEDIKRHADIMRATAAALEILQPFNPEDRLTILVGLAQFSDVGEIMVAQVRGMPDISELMEKVKPKPAG